MPPEPSDTPRRRVADPNHPAYRVEGEGRLGDRESPGWLRAIGEFFVELIGEAVFTVLGVTFLAALVALFAFGWDNGPTPTAVVIVALFAFFGYGAVYLATGESKQARWPRLAAAGAGALVVSAVLTYYGFSYR